MSNLWTLNGTTLPRNPDDVQWPLTKGNAYYETMLDGSQRRVDLPNKWMGRDVKLSWKSADARVRASLWSALASHSQNTLVLNGTQPLKQLNLYFDDATTDQISAQVYDPRPGQGGHRRDIVIEGRSEPFFRSVYPVPATLPTQASVTAWFGGPLGVPQWDGVPNWNGQAWQQALTTASTSSGKNIQITNMGSAPWSPVIRINGPFSAFSLNVAYQDVDGTGKGVTFNWTGNTIAAASYILFDTYQNRCWSVIGGVKTEVYTYTLTLPGSSNLPYPNFPQIPQASTCTASATYNGTNAASSTVDFSNNGTEQFRYL